MDEIWERAVESALDGQTDFASVRTLTLDGAVKCVHGRLPPPPLFERFQTLQHLSIANIGVSSLEQFPRLQNLHKLILSDNRIAGGLEFLVEAGLHSLRDLDLSNNRIQDVSDLRPLAELKLVSLDLYECPVTRVKDYRSRVLGLIKSLKYLDKMDAEGNERPESDDEDEDEEEYDAGSGEVDGEDRPYRVSNGRQSWGDGVVDVDEDESDADEVEAETYREANQVRPSGSHHQSNGFRVAEAGGDEDAEDEDDEDSDWAEEIDEEDGDDDDVVEVHEIDDIEDEEDGVEDDEGDNDAEDGEEVDNVDGEYGELQNIGRLAITEGEIDGHEQGEDGDDDDEDDDIETGEDGQGVKEEDDGDFDDEVDAEDEEEDNGSGYLVQPIGQVEVDAVANEMDAERGDGEDLELGEEVEDEDGDDEDDDGEVQELPPSSGMKKRKRDEEEDDDDDSNDGGGDYGVLYGKSSKCR